MSTKSTIDHSVNFHLFEELIFRDGEVRLTVSNSDFEAHPKEVELVLPVEVIEAIGKAYERKAFPHQRNKQQKGQ